jgi:hypothetical protein
MKYLLLLLFFSTFLISCSANQTGRVVHSTPSKDGRLDSTLLSEYFESKALLFENSILAHLVVTLGSERLPKGYKSGLSWSDRKYRDRIEEVEEIYLTNNTNNNIVVEEISITRLGGAKAIIRNPVTIPANSFKKTAANISTTSVYRAEQKRILSVKINGKYYETILMEKRTPVNTL